MKFYIRVNKFFSVLSLCLFILVGQTVLAQSFSQNDDNFHSFILRVQWSKNNFLLNSSSSFKMKAVEFELPLPSPHPPNYPLLQKNNNPAWRADRWRSIREIYLFQNRKIYNELILNKKRLNLATLLPAHNTAFTV